MSRCTFIRELSLNHICGFKSFCPIRFVTFFTEEFKREKSIYGSIPYGPFTIYGNNKEGFYLSELPDKLAKIFIDAAIAANPDDQTLVTFKNNI